MGNIFGDNKWREQVDELEAEPRPRVSKRLEQKKLKYFHEKIGEHLRQMQGM